MPVRGPVVGSLRSARANIKPILRPEEAPILATGRPGAAASASQILPQHQEKPSSIREKEQQLGGSRGSFTNYHTRKTITAVSTKSLTHQHENKQQRKAARTVAPQSAMIVQSEPAEKYSRECGGDEQQQHLREQPSVTLVAQAHIQNQTQEEDRTSQPLAAQPSGYVKSGFKKFLNKISFSRLKNHGTSSLAGGGGIFNDPKSAGRPKQGERLAQMSHQPRSSAAKGPTQAQKGCQNQESTFQKQTNRFSSPLKQGNFN